MEIPHGILVLREFVYAIGDRDWTDDERGHAVDLARAIRRRRAAARVVPR